MGRKILFITTDQQRFDSLGCNGNKFCRTPNIDALARERHQLRARLQPEHGLHARALDHADRAICAHAWRVRQWRAAAGRRAECRAISEGQGRLQDRAHRQGAFRTRPSIPQIQVPREHAASATAISGRGAASTMRSMRCTSRISAAVRSAITAAGCARTIRNSSTSAPPLLNASPGGDTGAPETANNPIPREFYHTDWLAGLAVDWLKKLDADDDWFLWLSFPDPHHPWDPPASRTFALRLARPADARWPSRLAGENPPRAGAEAGALARLLRWQFCECRRRRR